MAGSGSGAEEGELRWKCPELNRGPRDVVPTVYARSPLPRAEVLRVRVNFAPRVVDASSSTRGPPRRDGHQAAIAVMALPLSLAGTLPKIGQSGSSAAARAQVELAVPCRNLSLPEGSARHRSASNAPWLSSRFPRSASCPSLDLQAGWSPRHLNGSPSVPGSPFARITPRWSSRPSSTPASPALSSPPSSREPMRPCRPASWPSSSQPSSSSPAPSRSSSQPWCPSWGGWCAGCSTSPWSFTLATSVLASSVFEGEERDLLDSLRAGNPRAEPGIRRSNGSYRRRGHE